MRSASGAGSDKMIAYVLFARIVLNVKVCSWSELFVSKVAYVSESSEGNMHKHACFFFEP